MFNSAQGYVKAMGVGFASDACKTRPGRKAVEERPEYYEKFYNRGFDHIRLRIVNDVTYPQIDEKGEVIGGIGLLEDIKKAVQSSLDADLLPIVAYGGGVFEEDVTIKNEDDFVNWWIVCSNYLREFDNRVAFNLIIEIGNPLQQYPEIVNRCYSRVINYIHMTQPNRVIFCAPVMLSEPRKLHLLELPKDDRFIGVEIHDYAASYTDDSTSLKYWNESDPDESARLDNRIRISNTLDIADVWGKVNNFPIWWGAIMSKPYNRNCREYTPQEQAEFARFFMDEANIRGIKTCWNSDNKFINMQTMEFLPEQQVVLDEITGVK